MELLKTKVWNTETKQFDYYYPIDLEGLSAEDVKTYEQSGLKIGCSRIGSKPIKIAAMLPCKKQEKINGKTVFVDTPEEEQRKIFLSYAEDELHEQARVRDSNRCIISNGKGGLKRCQGNCATCDQSHNRKPQTIMLSGLDNEDDIFDVEDKYGDEAFKACVLYEELYAFVSKNYPKYASVLEALKNSNTRCDAAKSIGIEPYAFYKRSNKLREIVAEFLKTNNPF